MPNSTPYSLSDELHRLPLLPPGQLAELGQLQRQFPDSLALARELLRRDWLTAYQVNQLLRGRGHELILDAYVLLAKLGKGGMGRVFKVRHLRMGRLAALKVIRKAKLANPLVLQRFLREVRLAAQLDHPNVVHAYDAGQSGDRHYIVMEYVEGIDLHRLVQERGPLPVALACNYIQQAARGLHHVHERGLIHRDVKPHNLMVTPTDRVKLLDVGLARSVETAAEGLTRTGRVLGSVDYLAPEQVSDPSSVDPRADLYGLGCTLYFLLAGCVPFPFQGWLQKLLGHLGREPTPLHELRSDVGSDVSAVLQRLMAKRPEDRYSSAEGLAEELERLLPSLPGKRDFRGTSLGTAEEDTIEG